MNKIKDTAFSTEQYDAIYPPGIERHYWTHARNRIIADFLKKNGLQQKTILEIGCGRGIVVEYLHDIGMNIYGCDLADFDPGYKMIHRLFPATDAMNLPEQLTAEVEVILLLDVIEHIEKPDEFLNLIHRQFKSLRYILFTVPAGPELWSNYDEFNGHFRRYSAKSLLNLSLPVGFRVKTIRHLFRLLYFPALVQVRFLKQRSTTIIPPSGFSRFIHRIASSLLLLDYKFILYNLKGTSLIMLAQKS